MNYDAFKQIILKIVSLVKAHFFTNSNMVSEIVRDKWVSYQFWKIMTFMIKKNQISREYQHLCDVLLISVHIVL